jgi:DNA-binding transcriptional regulator YdaS (Cro superfamily)
MNLKTYIERMGDAVLAVELGVSHWTVRSWRVGTRTPRPEQANKIVAMSGGEVSLADIYGPRRDSTEAA